MYTWYDKIFCGLCALQLLAQISTPVYTVKFMLEIRLYTCHCWVISCYIQGFVVAVTIIAYLEDGRLERTECLHHVLLETWEK